MGPPLWSPFPITRWIACSTKSTRNRLNLPWSTPLWESPHISPLGHLASERIWTSAQKVSGIAHRDFGADRPDSAVALDENDARASRILFDNNKNEDLKTSTTGAAVGSDESGSGPVPLIRGIAADPHPDLCLPSSEENIGDTGKEEGKPVEPLRGMCQHQCVIRCLLTFASSRKGAQGHCAWGCCSSS